MGEAGAKPAFGLPCLPQLQQQRGDRIAVLREQLTASGLALQEGKRCCTIPSCHEAAGPIRHQPSMGKRFRRRQCPVGGCHEILLLRVAGLAQAKSSQFLAGVIEGRG